MASNKLTNYLLDPIVHRFLCLLNYFFVFLQVLLLSKYNLFRLHLFYFVDLRAEPLSGLNEESTDIRNVNKKLFN